MALEREIKLGAPAWYRVPSLEGAVDGSVVESLAPMRLIASYYDTNDLALARAGVTLRHRVGEPGAAPWTLKLPRTVTNSEVAREELTFGGAPGCVPVGAADLVAVHPRGRPLVRVARLRATRTVRVVRDDAANLVLEVAHDCVAAAAGGREVGRFSEVEVELKSGGEPPDGAMGAVVDRLLDAGATRTPPVPKLVRALGAAAKAPPDVDPGRLGKHPTVAQFARHVFAASVDRMISLDPALRLDAAVADVHGFRVATRRLRSDLRTLRPLLDRSWVTRLRDELGWLADIVGAVRDVDVLDVRVRTDRTTLADEDAAAAESLLTRLAAQRRDAQTTMREALASARYRQLIEMLVEASTKPRFASDTTPTRPARKPVRRLVKRSWQHLRRDVHKAGAAPSDDSLHRVRIVSKRTRYAAEAAARLFGKPATRFARAISDVQTVLGDHHDAAVTEAWLRDSASNQADTARLGITTGLLIAASQRDRSRLHAEWRAVWKKASAKRLRRWL